MKKNQKKYQKKNSDDNLDGLKQLLLEDNEIEPSIIDEILGNDKE